MISLANTAVENKHATDGFLADVLQGLSGARKTLPCKYLYDEAGSELFERICALPEYYFTRAEFGILSRHGAEIARRVGNSCTVIEYGSGSGQKMRLLLKRLRLPLAYVPVDIAGEQLRVMAREIAADHPGLQVHPLCADFTDRLNIPADGLLFRRRVVYFPGSTIGNLSPDEALALLRRTTELCGAGGGLLLAVDLKKDPQVINAAYNDRQGVTAAFNLNLLVRMNRELGADFQPEDFWHHAFYDPRHGRMEMHLVSRVAQRVTVARRQFEFDEGESICTEHSYKYSPAGLRALAAAAGFEVAQAWSDDLISVLYLTLR